MRVKKLHIQNYRSILDEEFSLEPLTVIVGPNGAGKSAVLRALNEFYRTSTTVDPEDFYNRNIKAEIRITITFTQLTPEERQEHHPYIDGDELSVTKVIKAAEPPRYYGARSQHQPFAAIRSCINKTDKKSEFNQLMEKPEYSELQRVTKADDIDAQLEAWEKAHPEACVRMQDTGQYFGFRQVGQARLERNTRFVLIPAVRDVSEMSADSRGSVVYELMELVVRSTLATNENLSRFKAEVQEKYQSFISTENIPQLATLQKSLTSMLHTFVPSAAVHLNWQESGKVNWPDPRALVELEEDGFKSRVEYVGHGLQRAFIMTLFQALAGMSKLAAEATGGDSSERRSEGTINEEMPDLILAIEEPELYQHPSRQRFFSKVLRDLTVGLLPGVSRSTQIIYCTHSPLFVDMQYSDGVRRLGKVPNPQEPQKPLVTQSRACDLSGVASSLGNAQDKPPQPPFTADTLRPRLFSIMTSTVNEGFFGDVVVLVEGDGDRAAILGAAKTIPTDLESAGITVVACGGKESIDRPLLIFHDLGIPTYAVFDADGHKETGSKANRILQRLLSHQPIEDFPKTIVTKSYAIFEKNLDYYLKEKLGDTTFDKVLEDFKTEYGYESSELCKKSPLLFERLLKVGAQNNIELTEISEMIKNIINLIPPREQRTLTQETDASNNRPE